MSKVKKYLIEKDGVQAETTDHNLRALEKRGWTVVEDGSSESGQEPAPVRGESKQPPAASAPATSTKE